MHKPYSDRNSPDANHASGEKFVLAHLSDPHIACESPVQKRDLLNKRLLGYLKWRLFRKRAHRDEILSILQEDLKTTAPDHIAVTGDLTHLGLPAEFRKAQLWLQSLGSPDQVTVVPGNHDAYVRSDWNETFSWWLDYMVSDRPGRQGTRISGLDDLFPTLRVRGRIALIGVCSARPSAPHLAIGTVGDPQLHRLETVLKQTAAQGLFRIMAIHHPPLPGIESWRRSLTDAHSLRNLVARCGAELILHGHVEKPPTTRSTPRQAEPRWWGRRRLPRRVWPMNAVPATMSLASWPQKMPGMSTLPSVSIAPMPAALFLERNSITNCTPLGHKGLRCRQLQGSTRNRRVRFDRPLGPTDRNLDKNTQTPACEAGYEYGWNHRCNEWIQI